MTTGEYVQFVFFKTVGSVPVELFHESWIPIAQQSFTIRGINKVILSQKVGFLDLSPYTFVSKNIWDSLTALKCIFPTGLPPPAGQGHITVHQGGIFEVVPWKCTDLQKHKIKVKDSLKLLAMKPLRESKDVNSQDLALEFAEKISKISGFSSAFLYRLHPCSGTENIEWMFDCVIEVYFDEGENEEAILKGLERCGKLGDERWEMAIYRDDMQLSP